MFCNSLQVQYRYRAASDESESRNPYLGKYVYAHNRGDASILNHQFASDSIIEFNW